MYDDKFYSRIPHIHFPTDSPQSIHPCIHLAIYLSIHLSLHCCFSFVSLYLCIFFSGDNLLVFALWLFLSCAHCRRQNSLDLPFCLEFSAQPHCRYVYICMLLVSGIVILIISAGKLASLVVDTCLMEYASAQHYFPLLHHLLLWCQNFPGRPAFHSIVAKRGP